VEPEFRAAPELAKEFERYQIICKIGEGGMGEVYKVKDLRLSRIVALKRLGPDIQNDYVSIQRFMREAKSIANLNHPNIVQVYDIGKDEKGYYISMEFIEGKSLKEKMVQNAEMDLENALDIILNVAEALKFSHAKGIIHRDIKPANIFLTKDGGVKIVDFGLAQTKDPKNEEITEATVSMGTPAYISPEQKRNAHNVDERTDIYSLGLVFSELLLGKLPRIIQIEQLPSVVRRIIKKALEENLNRRYDDIPEMIKDLKELKQGLEFTPEMIKTKTPEHKRPLVIFSITLIVIVMGGFIWKFYPEKVFFARGDISELALKLNGIIYSAGQNKERVAIINQRDFKTGEKIGAYKVLKIMKNSVILVRGAKIYTLSLKKPYTKKR